METYKLDIKDSLKDVASSETGLDEKEAEIRREKYGLNQLERRGKAGPLKIFLAQFKSILVIILIIAAGISLLLNEIIDGIDDGILIPPKRPNILAEKLELLINDAELRAKYGETAFQKVRNKFNWNRAVDQYLAVFSKLIENRR